MGWPSRYACDKGGYRRNSLCMFSNGDLSHLSKQPDFFVNKFQLKDDPIAYACMEDWYARRLERENELTAKGVYFLINLTPYCTYLSRCRAAKFSRAVKTVFNDRKGEIKQAVSMAGPYRLLGDDFEKLDCEFTSF